MDPILAPLWHQILCFLMIVFVDEFLDRFLIDLGVDFRRLLAQHELADGSNRVDVFYSFFRHFITHVVEGNLNVLFQDACLSR